MYEQDLALTDLQWLICHKTNANKTIYYLKPYKSLQIMSVRNTWNHITVSKQMIIIKYE